MKHGWESGEWYAVKEPQVLVYIGRNLTTRPAAPQQAIIFMLICKDLSLHSLVDNRSCGTLFLYEYDSKRKV